MARSSRFLIYWWIVTCFRVTPLPHSRVFELGLLLAPWPVRVNHRPVVICSASSSWPDHPGGLSASGMVTESLEGFRKSAFTSSPIRNFQGYPLIRSQSGQPAWRLPNPWRYQWSADPVATCQPADPTTAPSLRPQRSNSWPADSKALNTYCVN